MSSLARLSRRTGHEPSRPLRWHGRDPQGNLVDILFRHAIRCHSRLVYSRRDSTYAYRKFLEHELSGHHLREVRRGRLGAVIAELPV